MAAFPSFDAATLRAWQASAPVFLARQAKTIRQARHGWLQPRRVSFVFGCQRSGTKMVMRVLDRSPRTRIFHENHAVAFADFQLRPDRVIRSLVALNPAPVQIFKPICDSQEADRILARFPGARALWVFRHHDDVANSAAEKWGDHQRELIASLVGGDLDRWGWRLARVPATVLAAISQVYRPDLSAHEGALLFWYLRNSFFFALGLDQEPRVRLVGYEALVSAPEESFGALFAHVGTPFDPAFVDRVRGGSVGRVAPPAASSEIRALCADLQGRLDGLVAARELSGPPLVSPVLQLINTLGVGGAERYVVTLSSWLVDRGARVGVASSGGELEPQLAPEVKVTSVPLRRVRADLPQAATAIRRLIQEDPPAVIVVHSLAMAWIARVALAGWRIPVVDVAHGWPDDRYRLVGPLLRAADRVVAVSPEVRQKLVDAGLPEDRCTVVMNGVDLRRLGPRSGALRQEARAALGAGPEDLLVLTVGRLHPQKAQHHLVAVAAQQRLPRLRFAIVGTGERAEELAALVEARGQSGRVTLAGLRMDVPDLLGSADLYLSCSDWEGMSLTIIEAMAAGLPVVATRTEGSRHLLTDASGVLVPVGDVAAMAEAVARLAEDPAARAQMGAAARARALSHFGHERMAREVAQVLWEVGGWG